MLSHKAQTSVHFEVIDMPGMASGSSQGFVFQFHLLQMLHVLGSPVPDASVRSVPLPLLVTLARNIVVANAAGMVVLLCMFLMNGFVIQHTY